MKGGRSQCKKKNAGKKMKITACPIHAASALQEIKRLHAIGMISPLETLLWEESYLSPSRYLVFPLRP
jgi:hypothetical protein